MSLDDNQSVIVFSPMGRLRDRIGAASSLVRAAIRILRGKETTVLFDNATNLLPSDPEAQQRLASISKN